MVYESMKDSTAEKNKELEPHHDKNSFYTR